MTDLNQFIKTFDRGETIFDQGDEGETMYFIESGRVRVVKVSSNREQVLAVLKKGDFFGEMALISGEPRSARTEAVDSCNLLEVNRETLDTFLEAHPQVLMKMIHVLVDRLRNTDDLVQRLLAGNPLVQVVEAVLELTDDDGNTSISDMNMLMIRSGTDAQILRWVLKRLREANFIRIDDATIHLNSRSRLEQYLNFLNMQRDWVGGAERGAQAD